eukprot:3342149-Karenia_brevis.AAC.1
MLDKLEELVEWQRGELQKKDDEINKMRNLNGLLVKRLHEKSPKDQLVLVVGKEKKADSAAFDTDVFAINGLAAGSHHG